MAQGWWRDRRSAHTHSLELTVADSDYFIFPSDCLGYIPIPTVEYGGTGSKNLPKVPPGAPVQIVFKCHRHRDIAAALGLPPGLLPLFAALAGNDHANYAGLFWTVPRPSPNMQFQSGKDKQLLAHLARELAHLRAPFEAAGGGPDRAALAVVLGGVLPRLGVDRNRGQMKEALLASAASYELRSVAAPSPTFPLHSQPQRDTPDRAECRARFLAAFQRGELSSFALNILKHGRALRPGQLEMHELPSPGAVLGTPIRKWAYAVLAEAFYDGGQLVVTEVVREGVELVCAEVDAGDVRDLIRLAGGPAHPALRDERPLLLQSAEVRRETLVLAFGGAPPALLRHPLWPLLLALRHIRRYLVVNPWSKRDLLAAILTAQHVLHPSVVRPTPDLAPAPSRGEVQRSAELLAGLCHVACLVEVLLLHGWVEPAGHKVFDGKMMHGFMSMDREQLDDVVARLREREREEVLEGLRLAME